MSGKQSKSKKPLTKEQKEQKAAQRKEKARDRAFTRAHRAMLERAGFRKLQPVDGVHFTYEGLKSELDDIFVYENVVIFAEYTRSASGNLATHAKGKAGIHNKIQDNPSNFLIFFATLSEGVKGWLNENGYTKKQLIFRNIYASVDALEDHHKALFNKCVFMSDSERGYFTSLTRSLRHSSRFELFEYLGIDPAMVGIGGVVGASVPYDPYTCLILPEEQSHFPPGFRVVSFYVDPEALLRRCYVLRKNGWRDGLGLYQRLIIPAKITAIRNHLKEKRRVFANNIVITLPYASKFSNLDGSPLNQSEVSSPTPASLEIPRRGNTIGIIDGQHRIFAYYEDEQPDPDIDKFRVQQNLLATGIVYPANMLDREREKFEAGLFLEINSTQASASSDIIQAIWVMLDPFRPVSVARVVVNRLAETTPLKGILARTSLDSGKVRTASIVSYGLQPLTKRSGTDSLFYAWKNSAAKGRFLKQKATDDDLQKYLDFCVTFISQFLDVARQAVGDKKWRIVKDGGQGVMTVTTINSLVILMRKLIESGALSDGQPIPDLSKLAIVDFNSYKSSQYADLASYMFSIVS